MKVRIYTALDLMAASTTQPLPPAARDSHLGAMRQALSNLQTAQTPSLEDWRVLSDCVNYLRSLQEMGEIQDAAGAINDALGAMVDGASHLQRHKVIRMRDENLIRLAALLDDYTELVNALSARRMVQCFIHTQRRIGKVLRHKPQKGDVVVTV